MTRHVQVGDEYEGNRNRSQSVKTWNRALSAKAELPKRNKEACKHYSSAPRRLTHSKVGAIDDPELRIRRAILFMESFQTPQPSDATSLKLGQREMVSSEAKLGRF